MGDKEEEILFLQSEVNLQTSLALPSLQAKDLQSLLFSTSLLPQQPLDEEKGPEFAKFKILVTLKLKRDSSLLPPPLLSSSSWVAGEETPQVYIQANRWDMRLEEVMELACEYWGLLHNQDGDYVLLNEHGVWRELQSRVVELEPPTVIGEDGDKELTLLLFLDKKPASVETVRVALECGAPLLQQALPSDLRLAPVLVKVNDGAALSVSPVAEAITTANRRKRRKPQATNNAIWCGRTRFQIKMYIRAMQDPFLFSTRRWIVDVLLCVGLLAVLSVYLVDSLPTYMASQLFVGADQALREVDYDLLVWMETSLALQSFFQHQFHGFGQSELVGSIRIAQSRVRLLENGVAPPYSLTNEQTDAYWQSTPFLDTNYSFHGTFAAYNSFAYLEQIPQVGQLNAAVLQLWEANWQDNCTRLTSLQFDIFNRNFNVTVRYAVFVERNAANLAVATTRVAYSSDQQQGMEGWFIFFSSVFLALIGLDIARLGWFIRASKLGLLASWHAISLRNTLLNPVIFVLGVWGVGAKDLVVLAVCNVAVVVKLYMYFVLPIIVLKRPYWSKLLSNMTALVLIMLVCMCAFAWLLLVGSGRSADDFNRSFMLVTKNLMRLLYQSPTLLPLKQRRR
ncbi:hypothetical protein BASA81_003306 [Batrachochytrium salamandrivorans]|nr:hypothetical protein BASA81_003306 [Batrachochytrium salamandrivorans]